MHLNFIKVDVHGIDANSIIGSVTFCTLGNTNNLGQPAIIELGPSELSSTSEARVQFLEGVRYEYEISPSYYTMEIDGNWGLNSDIILESKLKDRKHCGIFNPGLATGTIRLRINDQEFNPVGHVDIEIRSRKLGYRTDYQQMLHDITQHCFDLLQNWQAPSKIHVVPEIAKDANTLGQQFAFIRSLLNNTAFEQALHRVISNPYETWLKHETPQSIHRGLKPSSKVINSLTKGNRRIRLADNHSLFNKIPSLPEHINSSRSIQTTDNPENRFVKFALNSFKQFLLDIRSTPFLSELKFARLINELNELIIRLDEILQSDVFRHLSDPEFLPLGSPTLQRREGYREILQAWMNFSLAAKLSWSGGENVYGMGQRDVATLYEYWVFFALLKITSTVFKINEPDIKSLLVPTGDGFSLMLKSGKFQALNGTCNHYGRQLNFCFSYNRSFKSSVDFKKSGSWTQPMRPDYTVSLWPDGFSAEDAESNELMVHIHFDAKYRIDQIANMLLNKSNEDQSDSVENELSEYKHAEEQGIYKRADLLKMHAYRDAIRRSHGAYVIYPGNSNDGEPFQTFHEILPGLGAFALRPGAGTQTLEQFLRDVVRHVSDRTTARERQTFQTYMSYANTTPVVAEEQRAAYMALPERLLGERHTPPADTHVLVGWCKGDKHLQWIKNMGKYNFRLGATEGGIRLSPQVVGAQYLLLYGTSEAGAQARIGLFRIKSSQEGPEFMNKDELLKLGYPTPPTRDSYAVFDVEVAHEFDEFRWDLRKLKQFPGDEKLGYPFATTLADLFGTLTLH